MLIETKCTAVLTRMFWKNLIVENIYGLIVDIYLELIHKDISWYTSRYINSSYVRITFLEITAAVQLIFFHV